MRYFIGFFFTAVALAAPPNPDAEKAAKRATVPPGMTVSLWAAEPLLANPVAITFDEQGRCYIAETTRFNHGVPDTRGHMESSTRRLPDPSTNEALYCTSTGSPAASAAARAAPVAGSAV